MRALYTSTSGMLAQQTKLDVISNNLANLNTNGYKAKNTQFAELLRSQFSQLDDKPGEAQGRLSPDGLRMGNGVMAAYLAQQFSQGNLQSTGNMLDLAIEGEGFFTVQVPVPGQPGRTETAYTRSGNFRIVPDNTVAGGGFLVDEQGHKVLDQDLKPITIKKEQLGRPLTIAADGTITVTGDNGPEKIATINYSLIENAEANLNAMGDNLYVLRQGAPAASVQRRSTMVNVQGLPAERQPIARIGNIRQGTLEMSNVDMPTEMSEMIQVQRALQMSARSVQTIDSMMGMANNLRA